MYIPLTNATGMHFYVLSHKKMEVFYKEIAGCFCRAELSENSESETDSLLATSSDEYDCILKLDRDYM